MKDKTKDADGWVNDLYLGYSTMLCGMQSLYGGIKWVRIRKDVVVRTTCNPGRYYLSRAPPYRDATTPSCSVWVRQVERMGETNDACQTFGLKIYGTKPRIILKCVFQTML